MFLYTEKETGRAYSFILSVIDNWTTALIDRRPKERDLKAQKTKERKKLKAVRNDAGQQL